MNKRVTVLRPDYQRNRAGDPPLLTDYVAVPRLSLRGWYMVRNLIAPEQLAGLARFTKQMETRIKKVA